MSFQYATVICRSCGAAAHYHREIGVSARQLTWLSGSACKACGQKTVTVQATRSAPPSDAKVIELSDDDGII